MPELILALDVGTTTARAAVVGPDGRMIGLASAALTTRSPAPGQAVQDAEGLWRTTRRLIGAALDRAGRTARDLAAVGVTTQRASAVAWDRMSGRAVTPLVLWTDLRGAAGIADLHAAGFLVAAQQPAAKLEAVIAASGRAAATLAWGGVDSWIISRLTGGGAHVTDRSQAWPTGYLSLGTLAWNEDLAALQGLEALAFPALVDTWGPLGLTDRRVLGAAVPITADVADQQSALIAHGESAGSAKITWGTSGTFDMLTSGPVFAGVPGMPPMIVSSVSGEARFCLEGMVLSAGAALDWLGQALGVRSPQRLAALAAQVEHAAGAAFLPALQGLGAPHADPQRRARLAGLTSGAGRAHLARAGFEGLAFRAREILDRAAEAADLPSGAAMGVDGGLTRSPAFLRILADLLGRPIRPLATPEATLMGAALLAARGVGLASSEEMRAAWAPRETIAPRLGAEESKARFDAWRAAVHGP
jgi:glycerol kinase